MELKEYFKPLLRWWWLLLLSMLVAIGSSYWVTRQKPEQYSASTTLIIGNAFQNPNPSQNELFLGSTLAATYVDLVNRPSVRTDTMEALGLTRMPEIRVTQPNNGNVIDIIVIDTIPERAQAVATEISRQLILRSPTAEGNDLEREAFINEQLDDYEVTITNMQSQLQELNRELPQLVSAREIAEMQAEIVTLQNNLQQLQSNYALLLQRTGEGAVNAVRILEPATLPRVPIDPQNEVTIIVSAGIGFLLAGMAAYLLEYLDDSIRTSEALSRLTQLPVLAAISNMQLPGGKGLVTVSQPRSPTSEVFRALRTAVQFSAPDESNKILLVTSGGIGEGKSTISSNLAVVLAQAGHKILLIDADLRRPSLHSVFGISNKRGLSSMMLEYKNNDTDDELTNLVLKTVQETRIDRLEVLTSGPLSPNPSELLGSIKMERILKGLVELYDFILLDSPPALSVTDAVVLGSQVDAIILVARSGKSRRVLVRQTVERFQEIDARILGYVLNDVQLNNDSSMYYYQAPYLTDGEEVVLPDNEQKASGQVADRILRRQAT